MAIINQLRGVQQVLANIKIRNDQLLNGYIRGLKLAALTLQRESQRVVPVDTGNLKASAFTRILGSGWGSSAVVGYTAAYALYVHELVGMKLKGQPRLPPSKGRYWDPQGRAQAKFLEEPARRLSPQLLKMIKDSMTL